MVSLNLCGRRRGAVSLRMSQARLPLNQDASSIYCSQRKSLTVSRKITQVEQMNFCWLLFCFFFCWTDFFFNERFYSISLSSIMHRLCFFFAGCPVWFLYRERRKDWLAVCSAETFAKQRTRQKLTVDSFTLKKMKAPPLLQVYARWNNCTV